MRPSRLRSTAAPWILAALAVPLTTSVSPAQEILRIPLEVSETAGIARSSDPVTTGVPLPRSPAVTDLASLHLERAGGGEVAAQFAVLARWAAPADDETAPIKWVLVDFQIDLAAGEKAMFALTVTPRPAEGPRAARRSSRGLATQDAGRAVAVDTGALRLRIDPGRFNVIDALGASGGDDWVIPPGHGGGIVIARRDGSRYVSSSEAPASVVVEENGPLRAVVRIDGVHRSGTAVERTLDDGNPALQELEYRARVTVYGGKPWARVAYTVRYPERFLTGQHNRGGEPLFHEFQSLGLMLPTAMGGEIEYSFGGEEPEGHEFPGKSRDPDAGPARVTGRVPPGGRVLLYQDSSGVPSWGDSRDGLWGTIFRGFRVWEDRTLSATGLQAAGWGDLGDRISGLTVGVRDFWQNFPKSILFNGDGIALVELWPDFTVSTHRLEGGRQKTHEVFLGVRTGDQVPLDAEFLAFAAPLHALAEPAWYRDTLALGPISVQGDPGDPVFRRYESSADAVVRSGRGSGGAGNDAFAERLEADIYGWRNFGDSYRAGDKNVRYFGNNEFDFSWTMLLQYLRRPDHDRKFFDLGESMARHLADIDIYHTDRDALAYSHGVRQHDASGISDHSRAPILSHFWIRGLLSHYLLTGDRLSRDAALETAIWLDRLIDDRSGEIAYHPQSRSQAWAALSLLDLWEATGDGAYIDKAGRLLGAEVIAEQDLPGARYPCPELDWEGDAGQTEKNSVAVWQNGYVAEALGRYALDRRLTGLPDAAAESALLRLLDAIETCGYATVANGMFVDGDESRDNVIYDRRYHAAVIDRLLPDGTYGIAFPNNHLLSDGFAYGALLTLDPAARSRYTELARDTWIWTMGPETAPGLPPSRRSTAVPPHQQRTPRCACGSGRSGCGSCSSCAPVARTRAAAQRDSQATKPDGSPDTRV